MALSRRFSLSWAKFRATKGAVKLHVGLDHEGFLPAFVAITDGKAHDINY